MILLWFVFHGYVTQALFLGLSGLQVCWPLAKKKCINMQTVKYFKSHHLQKFPSRQQRILINPPRCILLALAQTHFLCHVFYSSTSSCSQQQLCYYLNHTKDQCRQSGTKHNLGPFNKYVLPQVTLGISADLSKEYGWQICAKIQLFRE